MLMGLAVHLKELGYRDARYLSIVQDVYRWARCPPLSAAAMRAAGTPLPAAQVQDAVTGLAWEDFQVCTFSLRLSPFVSFLLCFLLHSRSFLLPHPTAP